MDLSRSVEDILDKARSHIALDRADCRRLLSVDENSFDSFVIRAAAAELVRAKNDSSAILLGQIGVEVGPCPGRCRFCTFGDGHTQFSPHKLSETELRPKIEAFCEYGDLYGLYLMTMHEYDLEHYLHLVSFAKSIVPAATQIWANVGDTELSAFREMKSAGVTGVYHVCRLGEGRDTGLDPERRVQTMKNARKAGLEVYTCCEPIGPEHTAEELTNNIFIGIDVGVYQHAAMRRVAVPGTPLAARGQITELRLAHIVACIALTTLTLPTLAYVGVHEPNELGYTSGANIITAESGANPRDDQAETSASRGFDMARCRRMMYECGFRNLRRGDESKIPLDYDYLCKTRSAH